MLSLVSRTHGGPIVRAAVFLALVLSVAGTMLALVPAAAYYARAQYAFATFDTEVNGVFGPKDLARLRGISTHGHLASFLPVHPGSVRLAGVRSGVSTTVLFADQGSDLEASWFTEATTVDEQEVGASWVDVSAGLARRLGASPGDRVELPIGSLAVAGRIRRVLDVQFNGGEVAVAPRTATVDRLLPEAAGISALVTLRTGATVGEVARAAASPPGQSGAGGSAKNVPALVRSRAQAAALAEASGGVGGDGLRMLLALGVLLFVGLAVREGHALVTRRADGLAVAVALGARRRSVLGSLLSLEAGATAVAGAAVWWAVRSVGFGPLLPMAWPGRLDWWLAGGIAAVLSAYLLAVLLVALGGFSYSRLLATIREGRSL